MLKELWYKNIYNLLISLSLYVFSFISNDPQRFSQ